MHKILLTVILIFLPLFGQSFIKQPGNRLPVTINTSAQDLYNKMDLEGKVNRRAFEYAVEGYRKITTRKKDVLTLIDFSKPSNQKRLFVFDMANEQLLFSSVVSHGKNSGGLMATEFSNKNGSHKSSLGFYLTENTYQGKNGYSLVLEGLEKGVNDNAKRRAIVIHGASYANPDVTRTGARLGRSFGCPALPHKINRPVIDAIKNGSVLYIYSANTEYLAKSSILKNELKG